MNKTGLIIQREYLTRVKKKSFIIMSLVGPLLMGLLFIGIIYLGVKDKDNQLIEVVDESSMFLDKLEDTDQLKFVYNLRSLKDAQEDLNNGGEYTAILHIPDVVVTHPKTVQIFYKNKPKGSSIRHMEREIASIIEDQKLKDLYNLSYDQISGLRPNVEIIPNKIDETGTTKEKSSSMASGVGYVLAFFIYMFIFIFGVQVMRGVIEEKTSRIVEVIISSVKPFQLMMGKIIGIALVALTQVALWVGLSTIIVMGIQTAFAEDAQDAKMEQVEQMESVVPETGGEAGSKGTAIIDEFNYKLSTINFPLVLGMFVFFFIGGYLLYGSLFAAIGGAVDNETDTQQFMLPITLPLIVAIILAQLVIDNPDGTLAFWTSIIPFTSPVVMMVRIPFGVDTWEVLLSMGLLILTFVGTTWVAGKIYRTGILMYGKKVNFKELGKWLMHKT